LVSFSRVGVWRDEKSHFRQRVHIAAAAPFPGASAVQKRIRPIAACAAYVMSPPTLDDRTINVRGNFPSGTPVVCWNQGVGFFCSLRCIKVLFPDSAHLPILRFG